VTHQRTVNRVRQWLFSLGYNRGPRDPFVLAKLEGLIVIPWSLPTETGGMLYKFPKRSYVYLHRNHHPTRQAFTLAHELVHFKFHPDGIYCESESGCDDALERQANAGAAEILMPEWEVRRLSRLGVSFGAMAAYFGVSLEAMDKRLKEFGCQ